MGGDFDLLHNAPSYAGDDTVRRAWARLTRAALSPRAARTLMAMGQRVDISQILRAIHVPTLVIHRTGDPSIEVERGRELAGAISGARFVELAGDDHYFWAGDADRILLEMQEFLTGVRPPPEEDRVLATVLFTDIVGSTQLAAAMGDRAWASLLEEHRLIVRRLVAHYRGREVDTAGDGFLVTFDGPARAVRCALEACESVRSVGIELRAGLHTGEIQAREGRIAGIAVHTAARISSLAGPSEVVTSSTVRDLVAGSGLLFADLGEHRSCPDPAMSSTIWLRLLQWKDSNPTIRRT